MKKYWADRKKQAAAAAEGRKNPIFQGGLGMYNNVVLHEHQAVIRMNTDLYLTSSGQGSR